MKLEGIYIELKGMGHAFTLLWKYWILSPLHTCQWESSSRKFAYKFLFLKWRCFSFTHLIKYYYWGKPVTAHIETGLQSLSITVSHIIFFTVLPSIWKYLLIHFFISLCPHLKRQAFLQEYLIITYFNQPLLKWCPALNIGKKLNQV